jgi:hypothetical protein
MRIKLEVFSKIFNKQLAELQIVCRYGFRLAIVKQLLEAQGGSISVGILHAG